MIYHMRTIYRLIGKALTITSLIAALLLGICIGIKSEPHTKIVYRQAPHENSVLLLASALDGTNALKPVKHRSRP